MIHGRLTHAQPKPFGVTAANSFASVRWFVAFVLVVAGHFRRLGVGSFDGKIGEFLVRPLPHTLIWMQAGRSFFTEKVKIFPLGIRNTRDATC